MDWSKISKTETEALNVPSDWLFVHYYEALNILFRFENSLRVFVYIILKNEFKENWDNIKFTINDSETSIIAISKKRINQAKVFGYLGYEVISPLLHLTSGELIEIIVSDSYWKLFKKYFLGSKEVMKNKLLEIGVIRNSLAHFRPIKEDDVEVIKQNVKQTMLGVEECLTQLLDSFNFVPTNNDEVWYKQLTTIGSDFAKFDYRQSSNEEWIRVFIKFNSTITKKEHYSDKYISCRLTNLKCSNLLINYPKLTKHITFLTESAYSTVDKSKDIEYRKYISIIFSKDCLINNFEEIGDEFKNILIKIASETELIKKDHLARGTLVENVSSSVRLVGDDKFQRWESDKTNLFEDYSPIHPIEYWGKDDYPRTNFITSTNRYPWMPSNIAECNDLPF
ncbi:MAG: hypothetical protein IPM32_00790 [Ignavibacteriae bacterium]|nr:hypothetical protein [Ignavibacteriota bacterium]